MTTETSAPDQTTRRRAPRKLAWLVGLTAVVVLALGACTPEANRSADLVNQARNGNGVASMPMNIDLYLKGQAWSQRMADEQRLYHSNLSDGIGYRWCRLGENVGYGYSIEQVHNAFMASSGHRANILNPAFNRVGVGVTKDGGGRFWIAQVFMQEC